MLRADARVVEAGRDRVGVQNLAVRVGEQRRARAVQDAGAARAEAGRAGRLDADEAHLRVVEEPCEEPDCVRTAADARDRDLGQPALDREELLARLSADHRLQLADDLRVRRGADARADQVVRRLDVRDPVTDRLARRLLQRPRSELDRAHLGAGQLHPLDVRRLSSHVFGAHVDGTLEAEARADGRGRDTVHTGPRLGFFLTVAAPPGLYTLSLHVALPILPV